MAKGKTDSADSNTFTSPSGKKIKIKMEKDAAITPTTASREGLRSHVLGSIASPEGRRTSVRLTAKKVKQ